MGGTQFLQSESAPGRTYDPVLVQMLYHRATGHSWEHKAIKLYTVEPLYNGHLGYWKKWPLKGGGRFREVETSVYELSPQKMAVVERWPFWRGVC